jgi:hypothetical protein
MRRIASKRQPEVPESHFARACQISPQPVALLQPRGACSYGAAASGGSGIGIRSAIPKWGRAPAAHRKQQAARGRAHRDVILRYEPKHILPAVVHQIIRKYLNLPRTVIQERLFWITHRITKRIRKRIRIRIRKKNTERRTRLPAPPSTA